MGYLAAQGTAAVVKVVKTELTLYQCFKCTDLAVGEIHGGCTSFFGFGQKKTPQTFFKIYGVGVCEKGCCLVVTSLLPLGYSIFDLTCLPSALKNVDFTGFFNVFLCQRS